MFEGLEENIEKIPIISQEELIRISEKLEPDKVDKVSIGRIETRKGVNAVIAFVQILNKEESIREDGIFLASYYLTYFSRDIFQNTTRKFTGTEQLKMANAVLQVIKAIREDIYLCIEHQEEDDDEYTKKIDKPTDPKNLHSVKNAIYAEMYRIFCALDELNIIQFISTINNLKELALNLDKRTSEILDKGENFYARHGKRRRPHLRTVNMIGHRKSRKRQS